MATQDIVSYEEFDCRAHISMYVSQNAPSHLGGGMLELWSSILAEVPPVEGRLLDIGTGGSVFPLISTSRTAGEIIATGYLESERQELQKWLHGDPNVVDLTPCFEHAAILEGYGTTVPDIETRIKSKVIDVLPCDVTEPDLLLPEDVGQFDVVTSSMVLDTASHTFDDYRKAVGRISQLVSPGGRLINVSVFGENYYTVGGKAFFSLPTTKEFVEDVLIVNGFQDISYKIKGSARDASVDRICIWHAFKRSC